MIPILCAIMKCDIHFFYQENAVFEVMESLFDVTEGSEGENGDEKC